MRKLLVLAIILTLSLSLVWAADGIKNTNQTAAKGKGKVYQEAPGLRNASPTAAVKPPKPPKETSNDQFIDPHGFRLDEIPAIQSAKEASETKGVETPVISQTLDNSLENVQPPTKEDDRFNQAQPLPNAKPTLEVKEAPQPTQAEKDAAAKASPIIDYLQQAAAEAEVAPAPYVEEPRQYDKEGNPTANTQMIYLNGQGRSTEPVTQGIITSTLLSQNFNVAGWSLDTPGPLTGWTIADSGSEGTQNWWVDDWHKFYYLATGWNDTAYASCWSTAAYSESLMSEWLITPAFDLSSATTCSLYLKEYYDNISTTRDSANIMISIDNGTNWARARTFKADSTTTRNRWVNLNSYVGPTNSQVKVGFWHFIGGTPTTGTNGWVVDSITVRVNGSNLWVQDFSNNCAGWFGNTPPTGPGGAWAVLDNGIYASPKATSGNDWNRRVGNLVNDTVAAVTFASAQNRREYENEWLISPMFSIGSSVACTLSFDEYWNIDGLGGSSIFPPNTNSYSQHGYVLIQETTDGGTTWGPWQVVYDNNNIPVGTSNTAPAYNAKFSLNNWRNKSVRLGFNKKANPDVSSCTWYIDDVLVQDYAPALDNVGTAAIAAPIWATEGRNNPVKPRIVNNGQNSETFLDSTWIFNIPLGANVMSSGFENGGVRPAGWADLPGTSPWLYDGGLSHGPGTAHSGSYAAYYNIYSYSAGTTDSLISPSMDLSSLGGSYTLTFWFWHNSGSDSMSVFMDDAGTKSLLFRSGSNAYPAWTKITSNFSSASTNAKIYFVGYSRFGSYNLYVDDVSVTVFNNTPSTVYLSGETVTNMPALATQVLTYANAWNNPTAGDYTVTSWTAIVDSIPSDNSKTAAVTSYPHTGSLGPDAAGYTAKDDITGGGLAYNWVDISSIGAPINFNFGSADARWTKNINLGFNFWYYGSFKNRIFLGEDGIISFDTMTTYYSTNSTMPSSSTPNNLIALFWDDLRQGPTGQARFYTNNVDTAIVSLTDWAVYASLDTTLRFDAQVIFDKINSRIKFQYRKFEPGLTLSHTIGIENANGLTGLQYVYNGSPMGNLPVPPLAITFYAPNDDIAANAIVSPAVYMANGIATPVRGKYKNAGATSQTFDARMVINDGTSNVYDNTVTGITISSGDSVTVTFPNFTPSSIATHTFTLSVINPGDEISSNNTLVGTRIVYPHGGTGGPDASYYSWIDNSVGGGPTYNWVDMSTGTVATTLDGLYDDSRTGRIPMGGSFYYYGNTFSSIFISTNGIVSFDSLTGGFAGNVACPNSAAPNNLIALFWDDLVTYNGGMRYLDDGTRFVIEYRNTYFYNTPTATFDAQLILNRTDSSITMQYNNINTGANADASVGIENAAGTVGLSYYSETNLGNYPFNGLAIKYFYVPPARDIAVQNILIPTGLVLTGTTFTPSVRLANNGAIPETFDLFFKIFNTVHSEVYTSTVSYVNMAAGLIDTAEFTPTSLGVDGAYTCSTYAAIVDPNTVNNWLRNSFTVDQHHAEGGPDAELYKWIDNTVGGGPAFDWIDMSAGTYVNFSENDDAFARVAMGAPFNFYGVDKDSITFTTNGMASFDYLSTYYYESAIPTAAVPNNVLAPIWDDLLLSSATTGCRYWNDVANNRFVYEYINAQFYSSSPSDDTFDVQIILNRGDSSVTYQYRELGNPASMQTDIAIGIENATGTTGLAYYYNGSPMLNYMANGLAIKFYVYHPAIDVAMSSLDAPRLGIVATPIFPMVHIRNVGSTAVTADVTVKVVGPAPATDTVFNFMETTPVISGGATVPFTFSVNSWTPVAIGTYTVLASCTTASDEFASNNTATASSYIFASAVTVPFASDFEANNGGFAGVSEWEWGSPTYASGPHSARSPVNCWGTDLDNTYDASTLNSLYSPPLDFTGATDPIIKFWMWFYLQSGFDGANIKISSDYGATWNVVTSNIAYNSSGYATAPGIAGQQVWSGIDTIWTQVEMNLIAYAGQTVFLRIDQSADASTQYAGFYIDDFSVTEAPTDDIGVTAILAPDDTLIQGFTWPVAARVHNFGASTQTNVLVHYEIYDNTDALVYNQTHIVPSLGAGADSTIIFPSWAPAEPLTHSLVSYSILGADINAANDTSRATTYVHPHHGSGSSGRWAYADNASGGGPAFSWIDISTIGTPRNFFNPSGNPDIDDGNSGMLEMGINFNFWNTVYHSVNISADGWLSFTDSSLTGSPTYTNVSIPTVGAPNNMVALLWDDLHLGTGTVYTYTDVAENQFIVEYHNIEYYSLGGPDCIDMEVIFDADNNTIKMQYNNFCTVSETDVTVGVENISGTEGLAYDNNGEIGQTPLNGLAVTFTYTPPVLDVAFDHTIGQIAAAGSVPVCANFTNTGVDPGNVTAHFEIRDNGNSVVFTGNGSGTIPANSNMDICSASNWNAVPGTYTINVTATVQDDNNNANNNGSGSIIITTGVASYPVYENFEHTTAAFPPPGWTILHYGNSSDPNGTWVENHTLYRSPTTSAFQDDQPNDAMKDEWLVMQPVDLTNAFQPKWKYYEVGRYFELFGITHQFYVGTGPVFDINTATLVGEHLPGVHEVPAVDVNSPTFGFDVGDVFDLGAFVGQSEVWCAFRYQGEYSDEWYLDDVSINGPDQYDAAVLAIQPTSTVVRPGESVDLNAVLVNNGYLPLNGTLTTTGIGTQGTTYNDISNISLDGFDTVVVSISPLQTTANCSEVFNLTSTVSAAGDTVVANNTGHLQVSATFYAIDRNIDDFIYYYWSDPVLFARKLGKPDGTVYNAAATIFYQDTAEPSVDFDFMILADNGPDGTPLDTLYGPVTVTNTYPAYTDIDISSIYGSLPDSFYFVVNNINGSEATSTGVLSDHAELGEPGLYADPADMVWRSLGRFAWAFYQTLDMRDPSFTDAVPVSINQPGTTVIGVGPFPVSGLIANAGFADISGGSAHMVITGYSGTDFDATSPFSVMVDSVVSVNFGNWTPSVGGVAYTLTMTFTAPSESDECNNEIAASCLAITGVLSAFEDFEEGGGDFVNSSVWQFGVPTYVNGPAAYSGTNVWGTVLAGDYPIDACDSLKTPVYAAPAIGGAMVVYLWYSTEATWDGLNVKVSVDGGPFTLVTPIGGYDFVERGYLCPRMASMPFYTGESGGWLPKAVDLTPYAGHNISFSFDFGSDGSVVAPGAYLDDFTIYDYFPVPRALVFPDSLTYSQDADTTINHLSNITIANMGPADLNYTATTSLPWITLGGLANVLGPGSQNAIDVIVNTTGISAGIYTDSVTVTSNDPNFPVIYKPVITVTVNQNGCVYIPGDINGNGVTNGIDVTYGVVYFKGGAVPPVLCDMCPQAQPFYAAGDVNGTCQFNGIDITYFVSYLKGGPALHFCATCPPATIMTAPAVIIPVGKAKVTEAGGNQ